MEEKILNEESVTDETKCDAVEADNTFGKFKNADELFKAYNELEKEFTKKSQRLKEMERVEIPSEQVPDLKLEADKFFSENENAKVYAKEMALFLEENPRLLSDKNCLNVALNAVLMNKIVDPEQLANDEKFLNEYVFSNENIRKKIVDEFLDGLSTPPEILKTNGQACIAPPDKPKTIEEAGRMLRLLNK
ncbi:MAG: hypothetical protein ACI4MT_01080 [Christensenellales bacterium]